MLDRFTNTHYKKIGFHALGILFISLLFATILAIGELGEPSSHNFLVFFLQAISGILIVLAPPVYLTIYYLIPKLLIPKKYVLFTFGIMLLTTVWGYVAGTIEPWIDEHWFGEVNQVENPAQGIIAVSFFLLIITLINLSYRWFIQLSRIKQMENDRLQDELSLLKNQINPHFFFNTLNNLYALALEQSKETPKVILKLSEMMRYTLYDCKETLVPISSELNYLENYIALQQIRHGQEKQITFEKTVQDKNLKIAPMLFIVFVENAFKHGVEPLLDQAYVKLSLQANENQLTFSIENNYPKMLTQKRVGGLGLQNVKRRLALIYPNKHDLQLSNDNNCYRAILNLQLK